MMCVASDHDNNTTPAFRTCIAIYTDATKRSTLLVFASIYQLSFALTNNQTNPSGAILFLVLVLRRAQGGPRGRAKQALQS